ncbi:hypothetical protein BH09PSE3_BH09PSE3_11720 [soil metagenome]
MRWAFFQSSPDLHDSTNDPFSSGWRREKLSHRAIALGLAIAIEILFLLALLQLGPALVAKKITPPTLTTFEMLPAEVANKVKKVVKSGGAPPAKAPTPRTAPVIAPVIPKSPMVIMSKEDFAASDISKLSKQGGNDGSGTGKGSGSAMGPGEGPGGEPMYNAEWYREPTDGELAPYLPKGAPVGSWALIACKTIEHYGVENCQQLGESPAGSGLARALRLASWQFKVRPPRIGGKPLIGAWVKIRFDFTRAKEDNSIPGIGPN